MTSDCEVPDSCLGLAWGISIHKMRLSVFLFEGPESLRVQVLLLLMVLLLFLAVLLSLFLATLLFLLLVWVLFLVQVLVIKRCVDEVRRLQPESCGRRLL